MNYVSMAPVVCFGFFAALSGVAEAAIVPVDQGHQTYVNRRPVGETNERTQVGGGDFVNFDESVTVMGDGGPHDAVTATTGIAVGFGMDSDLISMAGESSGNISGLIGDPGQMPTYGVYSSVSVQFQTDQAVELNLSYDYWNVGSEHGLVSSRVTMSDITTNPDGDVLHSTRRDNEMDAYSYSDAVNLVVGPGVYSLSFYFRGLERTEGELGEAFEIGTGYSFAFSAQTVPAPSGLALVGFGGLLAARRRRA